jgi:transcriptional regulator with XRE-family HTH domain
MPGSEDTIRRIQAARALAGLTVRDLAARIGVAGFGYGPLGEIERGSRHVQPHELEWIAQACDVDPSFFTADFSRPLDQPNHDDGTAEVILERLDDLDRARTEQFGRTMQRLDEIHERLESRLPEALEELTDALRRELRGEDPGQGS